MFTNLANYLLGTITNQQQQQQQGTAAEGVQDQETNLRLTSGDEDWVLVDRDSEGNSDRDSCTDGSEFGDDDERRDLFIPRIRTRSSSSSSLPCTTMEESWFITPPPCFTSAGPVQLETSPLENLLIEHPSMSVYHHHPQHSHHHHVVVMRRNNSAPVQVAAEVVAATATTTAAVTTTTTTTTNNNNATAKGKREKKQEETRRRRAEVVVVQNEELRVRAAATAAAAQRRGGNGRTEILQRQERQCLNTKKAQKAQIQKACQYLKKGYLERNNKAREVNNRNRRLRRGERSQGATRSHANNNRKC